MTLNDINNFPKEAQILIDTNIKKVSLVCLNIVYGFDLSVMIEEKEH